MPRDPENPIRTASFRSKLGQVRGMSMEEKALFQRIGNLVDTLNFTQRQMKNPKNQRKRKFSGAVPTPTNVQASVITGGIEVRWSPVDVAALAFYEVQFADSAAFPDPESYEIVGTVAAIRFTAPTDSIFARVRTVLKGGQVSAWTRTVSITATQATVFSADYDSVDPENRTTVSPKPTLVTSSLSTELGSLGFFGIGAYIGPSALTVSDENFNISQVKRNEVTYTLYEDSSPYPGVEQRRAPTIGEFIEVDSFYRYLPSFYMRFGTLPGSISDFFEVTALDVDPYNAEVEFLRYRPEGTFYGPDHAQTGTVMNATLAVIQL